MKCVVCHGDDVRQKTVKEEVPVGSDIVMVPVEAFVCSACGERYYDRRTMKYLESAREQIHKGSVSVAEVGKILALGT